MDQVVHTVPQRNIDMEVVITSAVGVAQLTLVQVAHIALPKSMKNKKVRHP